MRRALKVALIAAITTIGCERGALEINRDITQPTLATSAARVVISAQGLAQLTRLTAAQQLALESGAAPITLDGEPFAQLGPLDQAIPIVTLTAQPEAGLLRTIVGLGQPTILIPLRLGSGADTRICRWRVALTSAALELRTVVETPVGGAPATRLVPQQAANVSWASAQLGELGGCGLSSAAQAQLQTALTDYTRAAIAQAAAQAATLSPAAALGLPDGTLEVTHLTQFDNRRGQLVVGVKPSADALRLASDGLSMALDVGSLARPAACAPPNEAETRTPNEAGQPAEQELRLRRADAAIVIALPALERLIQSLLRAGFGCQGLEDMAAPQLAETNVISRRDARLADVGIVADLVGDQLAAVINLGDAARLQFLPGDNAVTVQLRKLSLDLHGEVAGVTTLIATLQADVTLRLVPGVRGGAGVILAVDDVIVGSPVLTSEWRGESPSGEALTTWARRLLLLLLDEEIVLPAPLLPTTPLSIIGAQVRTQDLILYGRL